MFSALLKAFTARAGFLPSMLALLLIALTSAAVLLSLPRIEQDLENSGQTVLSDSLSQGDTLVSLRAEGRNLLLDGQFEDAAALSAKLNEIEGVRSVIINGSGAAPGVAVQSDPGQPAELASEAIADLSTDRVEQEADMEPTVDATGSETDEHVTVYGDEEAISPESPEKDAALEAVVAVDETSTSSGEPLAQLAPESVVRDEMAAEDEADSFDQSSLSLRYDGTRLRLTGHLADEQMAQLIADRVANVIPAYSVLEIDLDGKGKGSPLNWMREFLRTISGLPDDAQGWIEGSDQEGVKIIPDVEQTLAVRSRAPINPQELDKESAMDVTADSSAASSDQGAGAVTEPEPEAVQIQSKVEPDASDQISDTDTEAIEAAEADADRAPLAFRPIQYISELNSRIAGQVLFEPGEHTISDALAVEMDELAEMMRQNPDLLLRVVGNIDFNVERRYAEYVGIDRAREIKKYLYAQRVEPFRIFATPLPGDRAYDKRVQLVFYISE